MALGSPAQTRSHVDRGSPPSRSLARHVLPIVAITVAIACQPQRSTAESPPQPCFPEGPPERPPVSATLSSDAAVGDDWVEVSAGPDLVLKTGAIVLGDPIVGWDSPTLCRTVAPGRYATRLKIARIDALRGVAVDSRVAGIEVKLGSAPVHSWIAALSPGDDPSSLGANQYFGHGVDGGLWGFFDKSIQGAHGEALGDWDEFERALPHSQGTPAAAYRPSDVMAPNVVFVESGWGDGHYPSYWGLDRDGQAVSLVTDFDVLVDQPRDALLILESIVDAAIARKGARSK